MLPTASMMVSSILLEQGALHLALDMALTITTGPIWVNPPDKKAETMAKTILNQVSISVACCLYL